MSQVHEEEDALGMWGPDVHKISGGTAVLSVGLLPPSSNLRDDASLSVTSAARLWSTRPDTQSIRPAWELGHPVK